MDKITTEKLNTPAEYLAIRCPECIKLFMVHEEQIKTVYPEFTCSDCRCHFAFEYPVTNRDAVLTFKVVPTHFEFKKKCPKCDFMQNEKNETCSACGVVIENYLLIKNETYPRVSIDLIKLWNDVLQGFENGQTHELFIKNCQAKNKLDYAEFKYKELGRRAGEESMVLPWLEKINPEKYNPNFSEIQSEEQLESLTFTSRDSLKQYFFQAYNFLVKNNWFYLMGAMTGIIFVLSGMSMPGKRNQIGLGIVLLLISLGLYVFRSKPLKK